MLLYSQTALKMQQAISYGKSQNEMPKRSEEVKVNSKKMDLTSSNSMIARIHNVRPGCGSCGK